MLNAGFLIATVLTAAGLAILAGILGGGEVRSAVLAAVAITYAIAGGLWCAVLAIRTRTTPALADLVATGAPTEPAEALLGAATGGLFAAFVLATGAALVVLGLTLGLTGGLAVSVAAFAVLASALVVEGLLKSGDTIPALL